MGLRGGREDKPTTVGFRWANRIGDKCQTPPWHRRSWETCRRGLKLSLSARMNPRPDHRHRWLTSHLSPVQPPPLDSNCLLNASIWMSHWCTTSVFCSVSEKHYFPKAHWHSSLPFSIHISAQIFLPWGRLPWHRGQMEYPLVAPTCSPPSTYSVHNYRLLG